MHGVKHNFTRRTSTEASRPPQCPALAMSSSCPPSRDPRPSAAFACKIYRNPIFRCGTAPQLLHLLLLVASERAGERNFLLGSCTDRYRNPEAGSLTVTIDCSMPLAAQIHRRAAVLVLLANLREIRFMEVYFGYRECVSCLSPCIESKTSHDLIIFSISRSLQ